MIMPTKRTQHLHQFTTNVIQVIKNRIERSKASFIIDAHGNGFFLYKGDKIAPKHFNLIFPVEVKTISNKGEQCSTRQRMLQ